MKRYFDVDRTISIYGPSHEEILRVLREVNSGVEVTAEPIAKRDLTHRIRFDGTVQGWIENVQTELAQP